jgi:hypothetical protein
VAKRSRTAPDQIARSFASRTVAFAGAWEQAKRRDASTYHAAGKIFTTKRTEQHESDRARIVSPLPFAPLREINSIIPHAKAQRREGAKKEDVIVTAHEKRSRAALANLATFFV